MKTKPIKTKDIERQFQILRTGLAIAIALGVAFLIIVLISDQPLAVIRSFTLGPLSSVRHMGNVLEAMIPLIFTGVGVSIIFSANQTNMAVEGGFFLGGVGATIVATTLSLPSGLHPALSLAVGGLFGALACAIPAILYVKFDARPVVSSLMVNYICLYMGLYIIKDILIDPQAGFVASKKLAKTAKLPVLLGGTKIHAGLLIALGVVVFAYLYLYRSKRGYEVRVVGQNMDFAKYAGMPVGMILLSSQLLGGFIAGMGGAVEVLGMYNRFQYQALTNHGFDGMLVGIVARYNPKYVPLAAVFLAYIRVGADSMSRSHDIPIELVSILQAIIIMLVVADRFLYRSKQKRIVAASKKSMENEVMSVG